MVSRGGPRPGRRSAGILLYRVRGDDRVLEVLLGHMGGPFWARKDEAAWSIPKGEYLEGEEPLDVALREFREELGSPPERADLVPLGSVRQAGGKTVTAWYGPGSFDVSAQRSNTFTLEWPPGSGRVQEFPEIDRAAWLDVPTARRKLVRGQVPFLDRLIADLSARGVRFSDPDATGPHH